MRHLEKECSEKDDEINDLLTKFSSVEKELEILKLEKSPGGFGYESSILDSGAKTDNWHENKTEYLKKINELETRGKEIILLIEKQW